MQISGGQTKSIMVFGKWPIEASILKGHMVNNILR